MDISKAIAEKLTNLPPSPIRRFFDLVEAMPDAISLSIGEPDFVTPWGAREAAIFSLERGRTHYTHSRGILELRQEISRYLEKRFGLGYDPGTEILVTCGVSQGIDLALRALINPGDAVVVPEPCYVSYAPGVVLAGGELRTVSTTADDGFVLSAELLGSAAPGAKALLFGYPNNPTGAVLRTAQLEAIAGVVRRHELAVISDEIYAELTYDGDHVSFASIEGMKERTVLLGGFSKGFAMTGWRLGYAAGPAPVIDAMTRILSYTMLCCPTPSQYAALESLKNGQREIGRMRDEYNQRRRTILKRLRSMGLEVVEPRGAFYAFPSIARTGLSSTEFAERLLAEEKVAVVPGAAFGKSGEGHVRCCYAVSLEQIEEAMRRMARFLEKL